MRLLQSMKTWSLLLASLGGLAVVWLVLLPWLASQPAISSHLDNLEAKQIDGNAMYYTELKAMEPILERIERAR